MFQALLTFLGRLTARNSEDSSSERDRDLPIVLTRPASYDHGLYEKARMQWQLGDWVSLASIDRESLESHPERAKLALMAAAGHLQIGSAAEARQFIKQARVWGCEKKLIAQILIAGVHNSLAQAAFVSTQPQKMIRHVETAIKIGTPDADTRLLTQARINTQNAQLAVDGKSNSDSGSSWENAGPMMRGTPGWVVTSSVSNTRHRQHAILTSDQSSTRYLLIDAKSLPRAGVHYVKSILSKVLQDSFSFCEWYQEVGCCKQMPCANTSFARYAETYNAFRVRLVKSHDFELADPIYPTGDGVRRIVLLRDPLFQLTSWFALDELRRHKQYLEKAGIKIEKIWLSHEIEVVALAHAEMNRNYDPLGRVELEKWLQTKSTYIEKFMQKWVRAVVEDQNGHSELINYENIFQHILDLLENMRDYCPERIKQQIDAYRIRGKESVLMRSSPFHAASSHLSDFLIQNEDLFQEYSEKIRAAMRALTN